MRSSWVAVNAQPCDGGRAVTDKRYSLVFYRGHRKEHVPSDYWQQTESRLLTGDLCDECAALVKRSKLIAGLANNATKMPEVGRLLMAIDQRRPEGELLHHSDRGSQYTRDGFREELD